MDIFEESCRICLSKDENCELINKSDPSDNITYLKKLFIFNDIEFFSSFKKICLNCVQILNNSYKFYITLKNTQVIFKKHFENLKKPSIVELYRDDYCENLNNRNTDNINVLHDNDDNDDTIEKTLDNKTFNIKIKICKPQKLKQCKDKTLTSQINETAETVCEICGKKYKHKYSLDRHKTVIHIAKKDFKCEICGKNFPLATYLQCHKKTHTIQKEFKCNFCNRLFYSKGKRREHEKVHKIDNLFNCNMCEKSFKFGHTLKKHMLIHSGTTPFNCMFCTKTFRTKANLHQHLTKGAHKDIV